MPIKRIVSAALALLLAVSFAAPSGARALSAGGFEYTLLGLDATVTGCTATCPTTLLIPTTLDGYLVTTIDVEAFAVADGYTQNRKPIENLQPGQSAVRVFHFPAGARRLSGRDVRVGVQDSNLDARLLKLLPIPPFVPPSAVVGVGD